MIIHAPRGRAMADTPNREKQIFMRALDVPAADARAAFIARECGDDEALQHRVQGLLQALAGAEQFLQKAAVETGPTVDIPSRTPDETPGSRIGPYKLLERIGEGGMGSVWMAEQMEPVRRKVALKVIKP